MAAGGRQVMVTATVGGGGNCQATATDGDDYRQRQRRHIVGWTGCMLNTSNTNNSKS